MKVYQYASSLLHFYGTNYCAHVPTCNYIVVRYNVYKCYFMFTVSMITMQSYLIKKGINT